MDRLIMVKLDTSQTMVLMSHSNSSSQVMMPMGNSMSLDKNLSHHSLEQQEDQETTSTAMFTTHQVHEKIRAKITF